MHVQRVAVACDPTEKIALALEEPSVIGVAQPRRRFHERIEHRLQIESRLANDLEHIGGHSLLLQGFSKSLGALLNFLEQSYILDGNCRLIGKRLDEINLCIGEWQNNCSP